jgi:uncharacterized protein DUF7024/glycosyl transferase family 2/glycosyl transferase family 1
MHIALINSFPNKPRTAEREFIARFSIAAKRQGHQVSEVVTSDDVNLCRPNFVITTHEFTPKLTPHLTLGAMWSPPSFYEKDEDRLASILSYDGHLVGSPSVAQFLEDLEFSIGISKPKSDFLFLPMSLATDFHVPQDRRWDLVYIGVHWDGSRHQKLFATLHEWGLVNLYGPVDSWVDFHESYRGEVPFDGMSVNTTLSAHGVVLCMHKKEHRVHDTPSCRLFEAAAAGCLIISDEIPFARRVLGDSALYIDMEDEERAATTVANHLAWIKANPANAAAMAAESHRIITRRFSLEKLVQDCCEFAATIGAEGRNERSKAVVALESALKPQRPGPNSWIVGSPGCEPLVEVIVRAGGRKAGFTKRAINSIAQQDFGVYRVLLIDYKGREDLEVLAVRGTRPNVAIRYIRSPDTGLRSTSLWTGLRNVTAPFFALLDDDDELMPDHFSGLLKTAAEHPNHGFVYSGVVRVEEERTIHIHKPHFNGPLGHRICERRELTFLDAYDIERLLRFDNYIQSNAWIARKELLDDRILQDPEMLVAEDLYLYLLLAAKTTFLCNFRPTAYWNWRSQALDNAMLAVNQESWAAAGDVLKRRLRHLQFPADSRIAGVERRSGRTPSSIVYEATLEEGIDFKRLGMPAFVVGFTGLSARENWGRWTDGDVAQFRFHEPLPARFALELSGYVLAPNMKRDITVRVGSFKTAFRMTQPPAATVSILAKNDDGCDTIFIDIPNPTSPAASGASTDVRRLGIALISLKIKPPAVKVTVGNKLVLLWRKFRSRFGPLN